MSNEVKTEAGPNHVVFFIDKEKFTVDVQQLTVKQLVEDYAKENTSKTTLGLKEGNLQEKSLPL